MAKTIMVPTTVLETRPTQTVEYRDEVRERYDHYHDTYEWHGLDFDVLSRSLRDLKLEPILIELLDVALVLQGLSGDDQDDEERRDAAVEMKQKWQKRRTIKLPPPFGFAPPPDSPQTHL